MTVLVPLKELPNTPGALTRLQDQDAAARGWRYQAEGGEFSFFFGKSDQPWRVGPVSSDAEFVCVSLRTGGDAPEIIFCHGSYVEISGVRSLHTERKVERCEFLGGRTMCSDPEAAVSAV